MHRFLFCAIITILAAGCGTSKKSQFNTTVEKIIYIGPQQVDCVGVGPQQCYLLKEDPAEEWTYFYDDISGFDYQPGYEYQLKVWQEEITNPPADGPDWKYVLVEQLSKTPVAGPASRLHDIWVATTLDGQPLSPEQPRPRLELFPTEGRVAGNGSCNNLFGSFTADDQTIAFDKLGTTKLFCAGLMKQEEEFVRLLEDVDHYQIKGLQLLLMKGDDILIHLQKVD